MNRWTLGKLVLISCILGGCATHSAEDVVIGALQDRDTAYVRLAKAITAYCSASTETMDARQTCILERRLAAEQPQGAQLIIPTGPFASQLRSAR
jgi:hypothetical protein